MVRFNCRIMCVENPGPRNHIIIYNTTLRQNDIISYTFWSMEMNTDKGTGKSSYITFLSEIYTLLRN